MDTSNYPIKDLVIIGGGIHGTAIALDAAGRGLSVTLCEQNDLASGTSSASSKLIHGGLRYLEHFQLRLVKEALTEQKILLRKAPHLVRPLTFVMPHQPSLRSSWLIRTGLFIYDHLARRNSLLPSKSIDLPNHNLGICFQDHFKKAFVYSDCAVDDARFVITTALAAKKMGADILTYTDCLFAERKEDVWTITINDKKTEKTTFLHARALINATGPWVKDFILHKTNLERTPEVTLVKGSHIIVPQLYQAPYACLLQHTDKRVIFVIPYDQFSLIGTTDVIFNDDPATAQISQEEITYLCEIVNRYFKKTIQAKDIISTFSGVRLLKASLSNPASITRDYELWIDNPPQKPPIISILGGKFTTHRSVAEKVLATLANYFPSMTSSWTAYSLLPGSDFHQNDLQGFYHSLVNDFSYIPSQTLQRYFKSYGTLTYELLKNVHSLFDLGKHYGETLYAKEVQYLIDNEWVISLDDLLWRRTKFGLVLSEASIKAISTDFTLKQLKKY